jgi:hypothetical protein
VAEEVYPFYNWQTNYTDVNEHEVFAAVMGYLKRLRPSDMQPAQWQFRRSVIAHQLKLLLYALAASAESYNKLTTVAGVAAKMSKYPRLLYLADVLINKRWHTEQQQPEEEDVEGAVGGDSFSGSAAVAASSSDSSTTWQSDSDRPLRAAVYVEVAIFIAEQLEYVQLQYTCIVRRAQILEHEIYSAAASREVYQAYCEQSNVAALLEVMEVLDGVHWHVYDNNDTVQQQQQQQHGEQEQRSYNGASGSGEVCTATICTSYLRLKRVVSAMH